MVRRKEEIPYESEPAPFHGLGEIIVRSLLNGEEDMYGKGGISAHTTVNQGTGIGHHVHENEFETYYISSGVGKSSDNGVVRTVTAGNVIFTRAGEGYAIENMDDVPLEVIALILYQQPGWRRACIKMGGQLLGNE